MSKSTKAVGTKFFKEGTQNQQILAKYWGNGKAFTSEDLRDDMDIASPGARLTELREAGFDVRVIDSEVVGQGRPSCYLQNHEKKSFCLIFLKK